MTCEQISQRHRGTPVVKGGRTVNRHVKAKVTSFLTMTLVIVAPVFAQIPDGVSPGAAGRTAEIEGRCPTFIWNSVPGAAFHELVGYRLSEDSDVADPAGIDLAKADQVLYAKVPGSAPAWEPELAECLTPGGNYVWFVRAVYLEEEGEVAEASEWSYGRYFSISSTPSAVEVEEAVRVLRRYAGNTVDPGGLETERADTKRPAPSHLVAVPQHVPKSVTTAKTAIKGTVPDATGETYGVVGISNSPNGAGVAAANTNGGPDLVLDGSAQGVADADLSESGIDRASETEQSFDFTNSDTGSMTLRVDGVDVVTTLTDQDTFAGLSCGSGEVAKWNGSSWACAPDANTDTDTLAGLSCGSGEIAKWNGSSWVCALGGDILAALSCARNEIAKWNGMDWGCAPDENTTYMFGTGLTLNNGLIVIDPSIFTTRITTLDSAGEVGWHSSIAIGADLRGLISYYDFTNGDLKVAHCSDSACTSAALSTLDSDGTVGRDTSVAIGADLRGLISYYDDSNGDLKVAHCSDFFCSSATTSTLDTADDVGEYTSVAIGSDGFGLISYYDRTNEDLKVAHCNDTACTSATINAIDSTGDVGRFTSVAIGADGLGLIGYYDDTTGGDLKVAHCDNAACSSATLNTIDTAGMVGIDTSVAIGADGLGLISHYDLLGKDLRVAHCDDVACTSATLSNLDSAGMVGAFTSVAVGVDGLGLISYYDDSNDDIKVAHCRDVACTSAIISIVDSAGDFGRATSLTIGADGLGLVSYTEVTNDNLRVAHLPIGY
jgi:hypothetical protein